MLLVLLWVETRVLVMNDEGDMTLLKSFQRSYFQKHFRVAASLWCPVFRSLYVHIEDHILQILLSRSL